MKSIVINQVLGKVPGHLVKDSKSFINVCEGKDGV